VTDFAELNGRRIAVQLRWEGQLRVCTGTAHLALDPVRGDVLRIVLDDADGQSGHPVIVILVDEWTGDVSSGGPHACDYTIDIGSGGQRSG
jgi:hypothetical protein